MGTSSGTQTTRQEIPEWLKRFGHQVTGAARQSVMTGDRFDPYQFQMNNNAGNQMTAGLDNPAWRQAGQQVDDAQKAWQQQYAQANNQFGRGQSNANASQNQGANAARDAYNNSDVSGPVHASTGAQYGPNGQVSFNEFNADNLQRYQNPHEDAVVQQGLKDLRREEAISQNQVDDQAAQSGAFGGARHGVAEAEMDKNYDDQRSKFVTDVRSQGYNNAVGQYNAERNALFNQTGLNNQSAGQGYQQGMGYAGYMTGLGQQQFGQGAAAGQYYMNQGNQNLANMQQAGQMAGQRAGMITAQDQAQRDAAYRIGEQQQNWSLDQAGRLMGLASGTPVNRSATTTTPGGSWLGPALMAGGQIGAAFLSDERLKEDVTDLKPEKVLGAFSRLPTKSYRYKDDAQSQFGVPERRDGFMAQDYERVFKSGVHEIEGYKAVDTHDALGKVMAAVKGLEARTRHLKKKGA
jgi:hypothetical protein